MNHLIHNDEELTSLVEREEQKLKSLKEVKWKKKKYLKKYRRLGWKRETKGCFLRHKKLLGILRD